MIVAGGFEADTHWLLESVQVISQTPELAGSVQQVLAFATLRAGRLNKYFLTKLGDINADQKSGQLRTLNQGIASSAPQDERRGTIKRPSGRPCPSLCIRFAGSPLPGKSRGLVE